MSQWDAYNDMVIRNNDYESRCYREWLEEEERREESDEEVYEDEE